MNFKTLHIEPEKQILHCFLNRPEKRNALNEEMLLELGILFRKVAGSKEFRVLVLRGKGKLFSAGADLTFMSDVQGKDPQALRREAGLFYDCFDALCRLPVPAICYAHGSIHGGANGLVAACDLVVTERNATFSFGEVRLGLVPATVAPFVIRRTGIRGARKMMLTGQAITAGEAFREGLTDIVIMGEEAETCLRDLGAQMLKNAPLATAETKRLLLSLENGMDPAKMRDLCLDTAVRTRTSAEAVQGIAAFFNRERPGWYEGD